MLRDETEATLNDLIGLCSDAGERYAQAAEEAQSSDLRVLLEEFARHRGDMCRELQALDRSLGDLPHDRDPDVATARNVFARLRSKLSADLDLALLEECEQADSGLAERMDQALTQPDLPSEVHDALVRLQCEVTAALGRLAAMRARL